MLASGPSMARSWDFIGLACSAKVSANSVIVPMIKGTNQLAQHVLGSVRM
jgi:hypothetical protein